MIQVLPEKSIIDDFVSKMLKQWPSWNTATPTTRLNDLNMAIKEICNRHERHCHGLVAPKATTGIRRAHFNDRLWQIEVDSSINSSKITVNQFAEILASAFEGLSDAELCWYQIISTILASDEITPYILKLVYNIPTTTLQKAFDYVKRIGAHNIVSSVQHVYQPKSIAELVSESCRQRINKPVTVLPPLQPEKKPIDKVVHLPIKPKPEAKPIDKVVHIPIKPKPEAKPAANNNLKNKVRNRIPTDICLHWIDILNKNYNRSSGKSKNVLLGILKERKLQWMTHHNLTIKALKASLVDDSATLRKAGLHRLADIAYNTTPTNDCLYNQLPWHNDYEKVKHLLADNMYGAAFDSFWVDALVEGKQSNHLLGTIQKVGEGISLMLEEDLPSHARPHFIDELTSEIRNHPRFWNSKSTDLQHVVNAFTYDSAWEAMHQVLKRKVRNGYDIILTPSLTIMIFISYRKTLSLFGITKPWLNALQANYNEILDGYQKQNGIRGVYNKSSSHVTTSGITQIHHPPTNPQSSPLNFRWVLDRKPDLSGGLSRTLLEHGLPYAGGISGSANIIAGTLAHLIKDFKLDIDAKEAILGIIMFVVYEGGHSIHEVLWTLYERELQGKYYLSLGLELTSPGNKPLRGLFVSDYEHFIKMYQGTETGLVLSNARNDAWQKTLGYFNKHSRHKDLFQPTVDKPTLFVV